METRSNFVAFASAAMLGIVLPAAAQTTQNSALALAAEQQEADYRVIAARCGTPAYEKAFSKESRAAVAAGLVSKRRDPAEAEKSVAAHRRSPFVLVAAPSDCPAQLAMLKEVQARRADALRKTRGRK